MQNPSEKSRANKAERVNGMEDSPMMTIEYLRVRLLAERLVSKTAKERADELAKRVSELEEQLKVVTLRRKTAEKATLDVLSFLASRGISDISEAYASESDQEESLGEYNVGEHEHDIDKEEENYGSFGLRGNNELSGSDHDSTPSSTRSLSWKGHKEITQQLDMRSFDSSIRRQTSLAQVISSSRHRPGKSCRQIRRRELRSVVEESRNDSTKSDGQDNNAANSSNSFANHLDTGNEELESFPEKGVQNCLQKNELLLSSLVYARECDASGSHKHKCSGEMERALEHQAQLIGCYKAQEKAQKDWEEKFGENNIDTPDSCEPGNHSDVTEERDENKAPVLLSTEMVTGQGHEQNAGMETQFQDKPSFTHFNSFKVTQDTDRGCSLNHNFSNMKTSMSSAPDSAVSDADVNRTQEHGASSLIQSGTPNTPNFLQPTATVADSCVRESKPAEDLNMHSALVPQQESNRLGDVLGALQVAKSLIKRQMNSLPATCGSVGTALEIPAVRDDDWLKVPVGCPGLFRVPTDLQSQASQSKLLGSDCSSDLTNFYRYSGASTLQGDPYTSRSLNPSFTLLNAHPSISKPIISGGQSGFNFHFDTSQPSSSKSSFSSYSRVPDIFPHLSSNQMSFGPVLSEAEKPSSGSHLYYGFDIISNMYR